MVYSLHDRIDVCAYWERMRESADERDKQKRDYASANYQNPDSTFYGLNGEVAHGILTHQPLGPVFALKAEGDGGEDFPGIDVKAVPSGKKPYLVEYLDRGIPKVVRGKEKVKKWPTIGFCLYEVDVENRTARYLGSAFTATLQAAPHKEFRRGEPRFALELGSLLTDGVFGFHKHACPSCNRLVACETVTTLCAVPLVHPCERCLVPLHDSSVVEHPPVKRRVAGSSPARAANVLCRKCYVKMLETVFGWQCLKCGLEHHWKEELP